MRLVIGEFWVIFGLPLVSVSCFGTYETRVSSSAYVGKLLMPCLRADLGEE